MFRSNKICYYGILYHRLQKRPDAKTNFILSHLALFEHFPLYTYTYLY